ncbi:cytochrome P450 93A3-like [Punica granatum]|uniref:Cytochrome P450 93A3-like n=1 Tax=Punica granatum TaxID=22663 RepID=A0A6P8CY33_PUNGR|nr:cytochrome P450 93A3-like [Punica granatum]
MESNMINGVALAVLVMILSVFIFVAVFRRFQDAHPPLPPGPRGLPFLGYLPFLGTHLHHEFTKLAETYGPIYKLWLGNKLCVVISSPLLAKEICREQDVVFANRDMTVAASTLTYGGKDIAFAEYGPYWRKMRKLFVREMMSNSTLDACYSLRRRELRKCVTSFYEKAGSPVDIGESSLFLLINMITAMLWGNTLEEDKGKSLSSELRKVSGEMMVILGKPNISDFLPTLERFDIQGVRRQAERLTSWFENFLNFVISRANEGIANKGVEKEKKMRNDEKKKDIVHLFLDLQREGKVNVTMSASENQELRAFLTDIVLGGTDTTSTMVEWVMAELMQHRDVLEKAVGELTEEVGLDNMVEEFHLPKLKYLDAVIKETFRLHPAVPLLLPRCPSQSVVVGRYTIPKGTKLFVNAWAIHRDPQLWEYPLEFRPERFLGDSGFDFSGNNFMYLPFGSGRRICPGLPLAEKMLKYILASLLHSFEWELPDGAELEFSDKFGLVCRKMNPLVAIPRPRLFSTELYM